MGADRSSADIGIIDIESFFPASPSSVFDLPEFPELSVAERSVYESLGIETVVAAESGDSAELASEAALRLLRKRSLDADAIDALILVGGRAPEFLIASEATRVQLGIGITTLAFSVTDVGCTGSSLALLLAKSLLESNDSWRYVLVAYGSRPAGIRRFRHPVTIMGDGGVAVLVGREPKFAIIDGVVESDGRFWDLFRVEFRSRGAVDWKEECRSLKEYSLVLALESRNRFARMNDHVLVRNGLAKDRVRYLMQNVSMGAYAFYESAFDITMLPACRQNLRRFGHLGPMDVLLNLESESVNDRTGESRHIIMMNNSPSAAWATLLLEDCDAK